LVGCTDSNGTPDGNSGGSNPVETPNVIPEPTPQPTPESTPEVTPSPEPDEGVSTPNAEPTLLEQAEILEAKILPLMEILIDEVEEMFIKWERPEVFGLWVKHIAWEGHPGIETASRRENEEIENVILELKNTTMEELRVLYAELIGLYENAPGNTPGREYGRTRDIINGSFPGATEIDNRKIHPEFEQLLWRYMGWRL
jgi:hypothetical protein